MLLVRVGFPEEVTCELRSRPGYPCCMTNNLVAKTTARILLLLMLSVKQFWFRVRGCPGLEQLGSAGHLFLSLHVSLGLLHGVSPRRLTWASS